MAEVADGDLPTPSGLSHYQHDGRCWVAVDDLDRPVAYLIVDIVDGLGHVEQVSVDARFARRGIGRALLDCAESWAVDSGLSAMSLTTFTEVPWNGPYYQRLGFQDLDDRHLTPGLAAVRRAEGAAGLDRWPRTAMGKPIGGYPAPEWFSR